MNSFEEKKELFFKLRGNFNILKYQICQLIITLNNSYEYLRTQRIKNIVSLILKIT